MLVNNISNKSIIQKLKINNLETALISNNEFNTLNGINTNITIQEQINDLIAGNIPYLNPDTIMTNLIEINGGPNVSEIYPISMNDGTIQYFKVSKTGVVYCCGLYINDVLIDYQSIIYLSYLNTFMLSYPALSGTNIFTGTNTFNNNIYCSNYRGVGSVLIGNPTSSTTNLMTSLIIGSNSPYSENTNNPSGGLSNIQIQTKRTGAITIGNNAINSNMSINLYSGLNSISIGGGSTGTNGSIYIGSRVGTYFNNIYIANNDTISNQVFLGSLASNVQIFGATSFSNYLPNTDITNIYQWTNNDFVTKFFTDQMYLKLSDAYNITNNITDIQTQLTNVVTLNGYNNYTSTGGNNFYYFPFVGTNFQIYPTNDGHLVNKRYCDSFFLRISDAMTGYFNLFYGNTITGTNSFNGETVLNNLITLNDESYFNVLPSTTLISGFRDDTFTTKLYNDSQYYSKTYLDYNYVKYNNQMIYYNNLYLNRCNPSNINLSPFTIIAPFYNYYYVDRSSFSIVINLPNVSNFYVGNSLHFFCPLPITNYTVTFNLNGINTVYRFDSTSASNQPTVLSSLANFIQFTVNSSNSWIITSFNDAFITYKNNYVPSTYALITEGILNKPTFKSLTQSLGGIICNFCTGNEFNDSRFTMYDENYNGVQPAQIHTQAGYGLGLNAQYGTIKIYQNSVLISEFTSTGQNTSALTINNKTKISSASPTIITATITLTFPLFQYYTITTTLATNVTMPIISADTVGTKVTFRKLNGSGSFATTFLGGTAQSCYSLLNSTTCTMPTGSYVLKLVAVYLTATTFVWAQI